MKRNTPKGTEIGMLVRVNSGPHKDKLARICGVSIEGEKRYFLRIDNEVLTYSVPPSKLSAVYGKPKGEKNV